MIKVAKIEINDSPEYPENIYKYRKWNDNYQKTIITEKTVFMAKPTSFEDEKDCKLLKRYDLMTNQNIFDKYIELSKNDNPNWSRNQHRQNAKELTKRSQMKNISFVKKAQENDFLEFNKRFGVLSLTANPVNLKMWNKYSDDGKGFCVSFYPEIMFPFLGGGGKVIYYKELPEIFYNDEFHLEHFKQVFSKEDIWEFEDEYRTHKFYQNPPNDIQRRVVLPVEAYKEIIFGWATPENIINEIKEACKNQKLKVIFKKAMIIDNEVIITSS
jgi:hypothetical protein